MRMCWASWPTGCRGRVGGRTASWRRRSRRSFRRASGWEPSRWRRCSVESPPRWGRQRRWGVWLGGWRMVAIDGSCLDVADTPDNDAFFGRPGVSKGDKSAFPQARVVALAECGTHAIFDAAVGPYTTSEVALAEALLGRLQPGMLLLADRGTAVPSRGGEPNSPFRDAVPADLPQRSGGRADQPTAPGQPRHPVRAGCAGGG